jgi:spoIIIJ-associated protein
MDKKEKKIIQETVSELLELLGVDGKFEIADSEEGIDIVLDTKDSGLVIGYHGDTLESLQLVISLCIAKRLDKFVRVSIEVGDYKKNRTEWLKNLAITTKERVVSENKEIALPELKSWERRIVHLLLEDDEKVVSESKGEGRDRVLVVSLKQ